jgi:hypothetical protein
VANAYSRPAPAPKPVTLVSVVETCYIGFITVTATVKATAPITVDVWVRGDNDQAYVDRTAALPAGTSTLKIGLPWSQQADVILTRPGASIDSALASKSAPAATTCTHGW